MNLALLIVAAWMPLVVHPVKDPATERLLEQTAQEPDPVVQELSAEALAFIAGKKPVPLPCPELPPTELAHRAQTLRQAGGGDAEFILANLHAPAAVLREEAAQAAQRAHLTQAVPALVPLLEDEDEGIRLATLAALLVLRPESEQSAIIRAIAGRMDHELSSQVCEAACRVLLRWHTSTAQKALLQLLKHPRPLVRLVAVHAVADWNDSELARELHPLLDDPDVAVAAATAQALEKLANNASRGPLRERLAKAPLLVQEKIVHALGELRATETVDALMERVEHAPSLVAAAAAEALGKLGDTRAIPVLRKPLQEITRGGSRTRRESIRALRLLRDHDTAEAIWRIVTQPVVPTLIGPMLDGKDVREEGLRYLGASGDRRYVSALVNIAGDARADLQVIIVAACRALLDLGGQQQLPALLANLKRTPPAQDRPVLCEIMQANTGQRYQPLPDQSHRRYFVESLGPPPYATVPNPPGIAPVQ